MAYFIYIYTNIFYIFYILYTVDLWKFEAIEGKCFHFFVVSVHHVDGVCACAELQFGASLEV